MLDKVSDFSENLFRSFLSPFWDWYWWMLLDSVINWNVITDYEGFEQ